MIMPKSELCGPIEIPVGGPINNAMKDMLRRRLSEDRVELVESLFEVARNAQNTPPSSDTTWTKGIKAVFKDKAKFPLICCSSDHNGEWLFDISWYEGSEDADKIGNWRYAKRLVMACECEWQRSADYILDDFLKLAWSNAELRIFIYANVLMQGDHHEHPAPICYNRCPSTGNAQYLLIGYPVVFDQGIFRVDTWETSVIVTNTQV